MGLTRKQPVTEGSNKVPEGHPASPGGGPSSDCVTTEASTTASPVVRGAASVGGEEGEDGYIGSQCTSSQLSLSHGQQGRQITSPTSRVVLVGHQTMGLPHPMMTRVESNTSETSPSRGIRMLFALRREPLPSTQPAASCAFSSNFTDGDEMFGDMITERSRSHERAMFSFSTLGGFVQAKTVVDTDVVSADTTNDDEDQQNALCGSGGCVGTTTGASFGRRTAPTSPQSLRSIANGVFDGQRYSQLGVGLFDSLETTWDMIPLEEHPTDSREMSPQNYLSS